MLSRFFTASVLLLTLLLCPSAAWADVAAGLNELTRLQPGRTKRVSSADENWQSGNRDSRPIPPGETLVLADVEGPGVIRHIWMTINSGNYRFGRAVTLRMYWDGQDEPAVEAPLGDFFAVGHGARRCVDSATICVTSLGRAFNSYWAMPFAKRARITLSNDSADQRVGVYWYVDYEVVPELPPDTPYFHAQYRQEFPAKAGQNYLILDAEGSGHYVGTVLSVQARTRDWFGEGDDFFFIDGATEPTLRGTGTEDYFCDAWAFREFNRPYFGVVMYDGFEVGDRTSVYRWHITDPIRFTKSLRFEIEHRGVMFADNGERVSYFHERPDLFSSVAFWYQTGKAKRFAELPPANERVVPTVTVELESIRDTIKASPAGTSVQPAPGNMFSSAKQLLASFTDENASMAVTFTLASKARGVARLSLGSSDEGGIWSVALDGKSDDRAIDLYSSDPAAREVRIGMVELDAGPHTLTFECRGRNPLSRGYHLGLDALMIEEITEYSVPAVAK